MSKIVYTSYNFD